MQGANTVILTGEMENPFITSCCVIGQRRTDHPEAAESGSKQNCCMARDRSQYGLSRMFKLKSSEKTIKAIIDERQTVFMATLLVLMSVELYLYFSECSIQTHIKAICTEVIDELDLGPVGINYDKSQR